MTAAFTPRVCVMSPLALFVPSACVNPTTLVNTRSAFAWCALPRLTGTWYKSVATPKITCALTKPIVAFKKNEARFGSNADVLRLETCVAVVDARVKNASKRLSNCTAASFSKKLRHPFVDQSAQYASGTSLPSISGNVLYARPASRPATYAPDRAVSAIKPASGNALRRSDVTAAERAASTLPGHVKAPLLFANVPKASFWNSTEKVVQSMAVYMVNAPVRCVASRYGETRGTFSGFSQSNSKPLFTIHQPMKPCPAPSAKNDKSLMPSFFVIHPLYRNHRAAGRKTHRDPAPTSCARTPSKK